MKAASACNFSRYIGIDYSGAQTPTSSLPGLRVYMAERSAAPVEVRPSQGLKKHWTRRGVAEWLVARLSENEPASGQPTPVSRSLWSVRPTNGPRNHAELETPIRSEGVNPLSEERRDRRCDNQQNDQDGRERRGESRPPGTTFVHLKGDWVPPSPSVRRPPRPIARLPD